MFINYSLAKALWCAQKLRKKVRSIEKKRCAKIEKRRDEIILTKLNFN